MGSTSWLRSNEYLFEHLGPGWPLVTEVIAWKKRKGAGRFGERGKWQCVCYRLFCASHHGPSNLQNAQVWVYAILVLLPNISLSSELRWILVCRRQSNTTANWRRLGRNEYTDDEKKLVKYLSITIPPCYFPNLPGRGREGRTSPTSSKEGHL